MTTAHGAVARFDGRGRVASIRAPGMTIQHGGMGQRTVVAERRDARGMPYRVVSVGGHRGYVERGFVRGGRPYLRRTYVVNGKVYTRVYGGYYYHGVAYYHYIPAYYYGPAFYGWAYNPWGPPAAYAWGWGPWYPYYGYYFTPYPVYPDASLWLTDYLIAANLQAAYAAQANAAAGAGAPPDNGPGNGPAAAANAGSPELSPEVKQAIADEVKAQLAAERDAAKAPPAGAGATAAPAGQESVPAALDPNHRTFIVATAIDGEIADGSECSLSPGDVLTRLDDAADANQHVKVLVSSSQKNDCRSGSQLAVAVQDLQEMHNHFQSQIDDGLGELAKNQGKNGLPSGPPANPQEVAEAKSAPDLTAVAELQKEEQEADKDEKEVAEASGGDGH